MVEYLFTKGTYKGQCLNNSLLQMLQTNKIYGRRDNAFVS